MEKSREVDFVSRHHRCVVCEASRLEYIYITNSNVCGSYREARPGYKERRKSQVSRRDPVSTERS